MADTVLRYYAVVLRHARLDTAAFFGWDSKRPPLRVVLLPAVGFGIHFLREGRDQVLSEWSLLLSFTVLAVPVVLGPVYFWNLIRAPSELSREAAAKATIRENDLNQTVTGLRANVTKLEEQANEREKNRAIITTFTKLAQEGDVIVLRAKDTDAIANVRDDGADWYNRTAAAVSEHCPAYTIEMRKVSDFGQGGDENAFADLMRQGMETARTIVRDFRNKT